QAHGALCSSRAEGLGVALLEAMALARPVIGFAVGGVPEIVEDEKSGLLSPAGDVDALAARLSGAARSMVRLRALGLAARARVVERFSLNAMCTAYGSAYRALA
ncbi:MAG: glycosyltransferase family 4 protein, partial [Myxococcota bacterium]|nr:glycosyltransferase family 4 protein [Myxococcota bacterium]